MQIETIILMGLGGRVFENLPDITGVFSEKENEKIKINII